MNTEYVIKTEELERPPPHAIDISKFRDLDDLVEAVTSYANKFVVLQHNPGGYRKGEINYIRSEHLTLKAAQLAAVTRHQLDPNHRGCVIYAVMQYANNPLGHSQIVETYPMLNNPWGTTARLAKRNGKPAALKRSYKNPLPPELLEPSERYFEGPGGVPRTEEEIQRALSATKVVGKGGSKIAFGFRNKKGK